MNLDQVTSAARNVLSLLVGWAVGKGYLDSDTAGVIVSVILVMLPLIWSYFANTPAAVINSAAARPEVDKIVVTTDKLADALPEKVVSAARAVKWP